MAGFGILLLLILPVSPSKKAGRPKSDLNVAVEVSNGKRPGLLPDFLTSDDCFLLLGNDPSRCLLLHP